MKLKELLEDIAKDKNIKHLIMVDDNGFLLENAGVNPENIDEIAVNGKSLTTNLKQTIQALSKESRTVQNLTEYNDYFLLLTMFPEDIFLMTIADKNISPQVLWNAIAKKYKEIAYELMG